MNWPSAKALQEDFGHRLKMLRLAWDACEPGKHSQECWAATLGTTHSAISRWENGLFPMPQHLVSEVVLTRGVTWDFLYGGLVSPGMDPELTNYLRRNCPEVFARPAKRRKTR